MKNDKFTADWQSLSNYQVPDWFRDAKFGIWAHWGPQCEPEFGDWYARMMYVEGSSQYIYHSKKYGHPSRFGFKDVINRWKANEWDPEYLVSLYKKTGARYFFAMGNHHDNLDLWDSTHHNWNSLNVGPEKNILDGWAKAACNNNLPFGVSIHSSHAWTWFETSRRSDSKGDYAGIPYDGGLQKADGKDRWWDGLDPQELYAQNHPLSKHSLEDIDALHSQWAWGNGASVPSDEYCGDFLVRTMDMIDKYHPELIYFDDTVLPLWPVSEVGLEIAARFYNSNIEIHKGNLEAVLFGKVLSEQQKECLVWDVERGTPDTIQEKPWQCCTCIGDWHYNRIHFDQGTYKSAKTVIQMLVDIVSKNGNLLLSVPLRGSGAIDNKELSILADIKEWLDINGEAVYGSRPWFVYGEGPSTGKKNPMNGPGFNEGKGNIYSSEDVRFTCKGGALYAFIMEPRQGSIVLRSLSGSGPAKASGYRHAEVLGIKSCNAEFCHEGLKVNITRMEDNTMPLVLKIS